jgi:hypothetical protein
MTVASSGLEKRLQIKYNLLAVDSQFGNLPNRHVGQVNSALKFSFAPGANEPDPWSYEVFATSRCARWDGAGTLRVLDSLDESGIKG